MTCMSWVSKGQSATALGRIRGYAKREEILRSILVSFFMVLNLSLVSVSMYQSIHVSMYQCINVSLIAPNPNSTNDV